MDKDLEKYINHLMSENKETYPVNTYITVLEDFKAFLLERGVPSIGAADYESIMDYSKKAAETSKDVKQVYSILLDYGIYTNQKAIVLAMFEFFEACDVPDVLSCSIKETLGENKWLEIMAGLNTLKISYTPEQRSNYTRELMKKLSSHIDESKECELFGRVCHGFTRSDFKWVRDKFLEYKNIDKFLESSNQDFLNDLIKYSNSGALFYGQQINDTVIDYLKSDSKFWWKRRGAEIFITKMPYRTLDFLNTTDFRMKQYYACHCAWARKSIIQEEGPVRQSICSCGLNFTKLYIEAAFDRQLEGKNIETALDGKSTCCTVVINIPDEILRKYTY